MDEQTKQIVAGILTAGHFAGKGEDAKPDNIVKTYVELLGLLTSKESEIDEASAPPFIG